MSFIRWSIFKVMQYPSEEAMRKRIRDHNTWKMYKHSMVHQVKSRQIHWTNCHIHTHVSRTARLIHSCWVQSSAYVEIKKQYMAASVKVPWRNAACLMFMTGPFRYCRNPQRATKPTSIGLSPFIEYHPSVKGEHHPEQDILFVKRHSKSGFMVKWCRCNV